MFALLVALGYDERLAVVSMKEGFGCRIQGSAFRIFGLLQYDN